VGDPIHETERASDEQESQRQRGVVVSCPDQKQHRRVAPAGLLFVLSPPNGERRAQAIETGPDCEAAHCRGEALCDAMQDDQGYAGEIQERQRRDVGGPQVERCDDGDCGRPGPGQGRGEAALAQPDGGVDEVRQRDADDLARVPRAQAQPHKQRVQPAEQQRSDLLLLAIELADVEPIYG